MHFHTCFWHFCSTFLIIHCLFPTKWQEIASYSTKKKTDYRKLVDQTTARCLSSLLELIVIAAPNARCQVSHIVVSGIKHPFSVLHTCCIITKTYDNGVWSAISHGVRLWWDSMRLKAEWNPIAVSLSVILLIGLHRHVFLLLWHRLCQIIMRTIRMSTICGIMGIIQYAKFAFWLQLALNKMWLKQVFYAFNLELSWPSELKC